MLCFVFLAEDNDEALYEGRTQISLILQKMTYLTTAFGSLDLNTHFEVKMPTLKTVKK